MHLNIATALLVTLLVTLPTQGAQTSPPTSNCPYLFALETSQKIDKVLKSLSRDSVLESARRSWVTVHVTYKKYISSQKIEAKIKNYKMRNNLHFKAPNQPESDFVLNNDPHIIETLLDLAAIDEVRDITLVSSSDNTNNQLDIVASKYPSSELVFRSSNQFKNGPKITVQYPTNYLTPEEIRQAATMAIYTASSRARFLVYETNPSAISVKTELTTSTYNEDKTVFSRGASIIFTVKFSTAGADEPNIRVAVTRNSITGAFDYARVQ